MKLYVGKVERIVLGKLQRVCACCSLSAENCRCEHNRRVFDTECPYKRSTY